MPEAIEILLVEDNPADAELTIHALEKSKLINHIRHLQDGAEALDFLFCRGAYSTRKFDAPPAHSARSKIAENRWKRGLGTDQKRHPNKSYTRDPSHFLEGRT